MQATMNLCKIKLDAIFWPQPSFRQSRLCELVKQTRRTRSLSLETLMHRLRNVGLPPPQPERILRKNDKISNNPLTDRIIFLNLLTKLHFLYLKTI